MQYPFLAPSAPRMWGVHTDLRLTLSWDRTWVEGARRHQDLARPRGVEPVGSSVSTVLTLAVPPSRCPAEIVGIPRFFLGLWHRSGVNVSVVDTDAPPGRRQRPASQPAATSKVPTRSAIPAARSSIILASWRRVRQPSGIALRP